MAPSLLATSGGQWLLEVEYLAPLSYEHLRPKRQRIEGVEAILHHLEKAGQKAFVEQTRRLIAGASISGDADRTFEPLNGQWIPSARKLAPVPGVPALSDGGEKKKGKKGKGEPASDVATPMPAMSQSERLEMQLRMFHSATLAQAKEISFGALQQKVHKLQGALEALIVRVAELEKAARGPSASMDGGFGESSGDGGFGEAPADGGFGEPPAEGGFDAAPAEEGFGEQPAEGAPVEGEQPMEAAPAEGEVPAEEASAEAAPAEEQPMEAAPVEGDPAEEPAAEPTAEEPAAPAEGEPESGNS